MQGLVRIWKHHPPGNLYNMSNMHYMSNMHNMSNMSNMQNIWQTCWSPRSPPNKKHVWWQKSWQLIAWLFQQGLSNKNQVSDFVQLCQCIGGHLQITQGWIMGLSYHLLAVTLCGSQCLEFDRKHGWNYYMIGHSVQNSVWNVDRTEFILRHCKITIPKYTKYAQYAQYAICTYFFKICKIC